MSHLWPCSPRCANYLRRVAPLLQPQVAASMCPGVLPRARHDHIVHQLFFVAKRGSLGVRWSLRPGTSCEELNRRDAGMCLLPLTGPAACPSPGTVALVDRGWPQTGPVTTPRATSVFVGFRF